jgi:hypothetical protein
MLSLYIGIDDQILERKFEQPKAGKAGQSIF